MRADRYGGHPRIVVGLRVRSTGAQIAVGLIVIALGALFTLDNLGVVAAGHVLRWWPVLPLAYGIARLTGWRCARSVTVGLIFALGGGLLLLREIGLVPISPWELWPVILIAVGASMVSRAFQRAPLSGAVPPTPPPAAAAEPGSAPPSPAPGARPDDDATFTAFSVWGHTQRVVSGLFRRGDATAIMAGHDLDLRAARIEGATATLDVFSWWGSIEVLVPQSWRVAVEAVPLMGNIEDSTWAPAGEAAGTLVVRGTVVMGNLAIKN